MALAKDVLIRGLVALSGLLVWSMTCGARDLSVSDGSTVAAQPSGEVEWVYCGCNDQPNKHFPYSVAVFKSANGDLVTRPERGELAVTFTALAVRFGERYCDVDSEQPCYGSFSHPCEFTDFRYGAYLEQFFPTCKTIDDASKSIDGVDLNR